jgi:hypothetical protein
MIHCQCTVPEYLRVASAGGAESIILSVDGAESMMLSDTLSTGAESAESIILAALPAERMILAALFGCIITLTAAAKKKIQSVILRIADKQLWSTASTAPSIGLPLKGAKFCHTSNILLVGHQCCCALSWLYLYSSVVSPPRLMVGPQ